MPPALRSILSQLTDELADQIEVTGLDRLATDLGKPIGGGYMYTGMSMMARIQRHDPELADQITEMFLQSNNPFAATFIPMICDTIRKAMADPEAYGMSKN